jgi:hypothetical protein
MPKQTHGWKPAEEAIRRVLMSDWDPIGCGVPDDEYDRYIPVIFRLIQARVGVADLASHLQMLETEWIGLPARPEVNQRVAGLLLDLME